MLKENKVTEDNVKTLSLQELRRLYRPMLPDQKPRETNSPQAIIERELSSRESELMGEA